jgi:hypothetical protein
MASFFSEDSRCFSPNEFRFENCVMSLAVQKNMFITGCCCEKQIAISNYDCNFTYSWKMNSTSPHERVKGENWVGHSSSVGYFRPCLQNDYSVPVLPLPGENTESRRVRCCRRLHATGCSYSRRVYSRDKRVWSKMAAWLVLCFQYVHRGYLRLFLLSRINSCQIWLPFGAVSFPLEITRLPAMAAKELIVFMWSYFTRLLYNPETIFPNLKTYRSDWRSK